MKSKILSEDVIAQEIKSWFYEFIKDADADDLARFAGEIFGGKCFPVCDDFGSDIEYEFTPNELYTGRFENLELFDCYGGFQVGDVVDVTPVDGDDFHEFTGRVDGFRYEFVIVVDSEDNGFDVLPSQLAKLF